MHASNLLTIDDIFKELEIVRNCRGLLQGPHHQFDVYGHSDNCFRTILDISGDPHETVAARLHDVGKVGTRKDLLREDGSVWYREDDLNTPYNSFPGHEFEGRALVLEIDSTLFAQFELSQPLIANLVAHHYLPMKQIKAMREQTSFEGFQWELGLLIDGLEKAPVTKESIMTLFYADKIAQGENCSDQIELLAIRGLILGTPGMSAGAIYGLQQKTYHKK